MSRWGVLRNEFSLDAMRERARRKRVLREASFYLDLWADYGDEGHLAEALAILASRAVTGGEA